MKLSPIVNSVILAMAVVGCTTTAQRQEFTTIGMVEQAAQSSYNQYSNMVISGQVSTNGLHDVSMKFNDLQASLRLAAVVAESGTNAVAPQKLQAEAGDLLALIANLRKK